MGILPKHQAPAQANSLEGEFAASFFNGNLHLSLLPTEQCNFRCTYCYEDFSIGRMTAEVRQGVKRLIDRRLDGLRSLSVSWFGGEPLLARDIITDISDHIVRSSVARPELDYAGDITTNGYLLDHAAVERLAELGIRSYQISLDGPRELHDRTRLRANRKGSFDRIWGNLLAIRDGCAQVRVVLRIHLTPGNIPAMPDFLAQIRDTFLRDKRFPLLLKPIESMGGLNGDTISVIPADERPRILAALQAIVLDEGDSDRLFSGDEICYAARANSLVVRADGRIGKCTVALTDPVNTIGRLLPNGVLQIDNDVLGAWLRGWENGDRAFLACPYSCIPHNQPENHPELLQINASTRGVKTAHA